MSKWCAARAKFSPNLNHLNVRLSEHGGHQEEDAEHEGGEG